MTSQSSLTQPELPQESRSGSPFLVALLIAVLATAGFVLVRSSVAGNENNEATQADDEKDPEAKTETAVTGPDGKPIDNPFPNRFPAPELDGGAAWLNTSGPISKRDLRGKIVLIDFWTYCCINCMHVLPDLKYLEHKYPNEIVVIGCHSAKFDNEKDTEAIRRAILRYEIEHPVINDNEMQVWRKFGARSWPTLVLIDPEGNYCGYVSGEGNRELLDTVIQRLIAYHKAKGTLDQTPVQFDLEANHAKSGPLRFPGKILADQTGGRLFISDSNHNRIVISSMDGRLLDVIGSGAIGAQDGSYEEARFDHPQGMKLIGNTLYVADTENHLLRTVDLEKRTVATLAGTGEQARFRARGGELLKTALNSPWDLEEANGWLFVAMAGPHQIWAHKLGSNDIGVFSGTGREDITDGPHDAAALAQPSGLVSDGSFIYVADSEGSSIRKMSVDPKGTIVTIAGEHDLPSGRTLFEFGDVDGIGGAARLQHPLGVALDGTTLYVADAYNHKIRAIDLKTSAVSTFLGDGSMGTSLSPVRLHEPAGMAIAAGKMLIADTNNHRIVAVDLQTKEATEFVVQGLTPPAPVSGSGGPEVAAADKTMQAEIQQVASGTVKLQVTLQIPEGYKLNDLMAVTARFSAVDGQSLLAAEATDKRLKGAVEGNVVTFDVPVAAASGSGNYQLAVSYSYCSTGTGGLCKLHTARWSIPIEVIGNGAGSIALTTDMPK